MKSLLIKIGGGMLVLAVVAGATAYFALTGGGQIDVNRTIVNTNQEGFSQQVLPNTQATLPNGGLRPRGGEQTPQPPAQPEPTPVATTTEAASSTDAAAPAEETQGEQPQ